MGRLTVWQAKAKQAAASVRAEYEAGKRGDETAAAPIWATPQQQLDGLLAVFASRNAETSAPETSVPESSVPESSAAPESFGPESSAAPESSVPESADDAATVAEALRGVDWVGVRAATAERTAEATKAIKEMADHVDWAKVQPVAAQVSSALIAAIATGRLGVGGRLGSTVARAITNQGGLGQQVAAKLQQSPSGVPTDLGSTIAAVSRED